MSRYEVVVRGSEDGFVAEFNSKEIDLQSEGNTLSEALMSLAEELALHENDSEPLPENVESTRIMNDFM